MHEHTNNNNDNNDGDDDARLARLMHLTADEWSEMMEQEWVQVANHNLRVKMSIITEQLREKRLRRAPLSPAATTSDPSSDSSTDTMETTMVSAGPASAPITTSTTAAAPSTSAAPAGITESAPESGAAAAAAADSMLASKCSHCKRKLRLAGSFKCRCNLTFCTGHRQSWEHNCTFDYKTFGRQQLARANPAFTLPKI